MQQTGRCPNCGSPVTFGQRFCGGCGGQLSTGCAYCGTPFSPGARFCANCGAPVGGAAPPQQPGWGAPPPGGPQQQPGWGAPQQQPGWGAQPQTWGAPPRRAQQSSNRPLLLVLLVVLLLGLGGIVYWRWGDQLLGLLSSSPVAPADTTAPTISSITESDITYQGATISWVTDEAASGQVLYGATEECELETTWQLPATSPSSPGVYPLSVTLTGLDGNTAYYYKVKSKDAAGNPKESPVRSFATEARPP